MRTLSREPGPAGSPVEFAPLQFADEAALTESLRGAETLYNTYWIRFPRGGSTFERAVENTRTLLRCAGEAGVRRFVQVSVSSPSRDSSLPYFRGKAAVERELSVLGLPYAIVRPTLVFGARDILVNNIAWILRRLPLFVVPGDGRYRLQPVYVEDVAQLCVGLGSRSDDVVVDAVGPETYTFDELVRAVRDAVGSRARVVHAPTSVALALGTTIGRFVRDVLVTPEELECLMANLLVSGGPPTGETSFRAWVGAHGNELGRAYASELARHFGR